MEEMRDGEKWLKSWARRDFGAGMKIEKAWALPLKSTALKHILEALLERMLHMVGIPARRQPHTDLAPCAAKSGETGHD